MNELTQINDVLKHLQEKGSITSVDAFYDYGVSRLSAVIYVLRNRGHIIESKTEKGKTRYNRPCKWARYVYKGSVASENCGN